MAKVSPRKPAMPNAMTMLVLRNSRSRSRRSASIGASRWVSTHTRAANDAAPATPRPSTQGSSHPTRGPSLNA